MKGRKLVLGRLGLAACVCLCMCWGVTSAYGVAFINEFHYDNDGTDAGEFIEVVLDRVTDPLDVTVTLYNGSATVLKPYATHALSTFTAHGTLADGYVYYSLTLPSNGIQNGAPDGIAIDIAGVLEEFLSYEGDFIATTGPADGVQSVDIGVAQSSSTPVGSSLQRVDFGSTWVATDGVNTQGAINFQVSCPEDIITIAILTDSYGSETSWELTDHATSVVVASSNGLDSSTLHIWDVCVDSNGCHDFTIFDSWGDGIFSPGYYEVYYNGDLIASGGDFDYSETVEYIGDACVIPSGACCVDSECVATNTKAECDVLGGLWFAGENCEGVFLCPCEDAIYFNGYYDKVNALHNGRFDDDSHAWRIVDDVLFGADVTIQDLHWWGNEPVWDALTTNGFNWTDQTVDYIILADSNGVPGPVVASANGIAAIRTDTGDTAFGDPIWFYEINGLNIPLPAGAYWFGMRPVQNQPYGTAQFDHGWWTTAPNNGTSLYYTDGGVIGGGFSEGTTYEAVAFCVTGEAGEPVTGACCDDMTGLCDDGIELLACEGRFARDTLCTELDPPCGELIGACCFEDGHCEELTGNACAAAAGNYQGMYTVCDPNPCPQPPPANDLCSNAIELTMPFEDLDVNYGTATSDLDVSCNSSYSCDNETAHGIWYKYMPAEDCEITITRVGNPNYEDTVAAIFSGPDCNTNNLVEEVCEDDETMSFDLTGGTQYFILIGTWSCSSEPDDNLDIYFDCINGACCNTNGTCTIETPTACVAENGVYMGDGTTCDPDPCITGACCIDANCTVMFEDDCITAGGEYLGDMTDCDPNMCGGACCFEDGSCQFTTEEACTNGLGGDYLGDGTVCDPNPCPQPPPANDECENAEEILLSKAIVTGDTTWATSDIEYPCELYSGPWKNVWYKVTGTGTTMTASLCNTVPDWDTKIAVYCYGCDYPICVDGNDDGCTGTYLSEVSWCSTEFTTYYITVGGYSASYYGPFELEVTADAVVCEGAVDCTWPLGACCNTNGTCVDNVIELECVENGTWTAGMVCAGEDCNINGIDDACEPCGDNNGDGYTDLVDLATLVSCLTGPGGTASAECLCMLDADDDGDLDLRDYAAFQLCFSPRPIGACCFADASCQELTEDDCAAAAGTYMGDDTVCDPNPCPPVNDTCDGAIVVNCGDTLIDESNETANNDYDPGSGGCTGYSATGPDVTYSLTLAEFTDVTITMDAAFDASLYVVTDCADPENTCVVGDDSGNPETVNFIAEPGVTYYIIADGYSLSSSGLFELDVACVVLPTGACCVDDECRVITAYECTVMTNGVYVGDDVPCDPDPCTAGACCYSDGSCQELTDPDCIAAGGTYSGPGTSCTPNECPQPGDNCGMPLVFADEFINSNSTCGRVDDYYEETCPGYYDHGEDIIYEWTVTEAACYDLTIDPHGTTYSGIAVGSNGACPPDPCLAVDTSSSSSPHGITELEMVPGVYYIIIDTWASPDCIPSFILTVEHCPTGACCGTNGMCTIEKPADCEAENGFYLGDDITCDGDPCATGACCLADGSCIEVDEAYCLSTNGVFEGWGTNCATTECPQPPPANDDCANAEAIGDVSRNAFDTTWATNDGIGEYTTGPNIWYCYTASCTGTATISLCGSSFDTKLAAYDGCSCDPLGTQLAYNDDNYSACGSGGNSQIDALDVIADQQYLIEVGGYLSHAGEGLLEITCVPTPTGACCGTNGLCAVVTEDECNAENGLYLGDYITCDGDPCATGACCLPDGSCIDVDEAYCVSTNGAFEGGGTNCATTECPQPCVPDITVDFATDLPYTDVGDTTCELGNDYSDTCLGSYDSGEEIIYELTVPAAICVDITLTSDTTYTGMGVGAECPPAICIASSTSSSTDEEIVGLNLTAGTYYLMIDTWSTPFCITTFDLVIEECPSIGACCRDYNASCDDDIAEAACDGVNDTWFAGEACLDVTCPEPPLANDECEGALSIACGGSAATDNCTATSGVDDPSPSCAYGEYGSVFFTFVATETSARVRTDLNSTGTDSEYAVYEVNQADICNETSWTELGCSQDEGLGYNGDICVTGLTVGDTYVIMLTSYSSYTCDSYTVDIECPCP